MGPGRRHHIKPEETAQSLKPAAGSYGKGYKEKTITAEDRKLVGVPEAGTAIRSRRYPTPGGRQIRSMLSSRSLWTEKGLAPAPQADRNTLIRRAYLDLIGLLPSPHRSGRLRQRSLAPAYENLIERLLSSPHYGERWGRFWLDVARYADSSGYRT